MPRKITQIATASRLDDPLKLFALADDGTLWELDCKMERKWRLVLSLPDCDEYLAGCDQL